MTQPLFDKGTPECIAEATPPLPFSLDELLDANHPARIVWATDPDARNMKFPNGGYAPGYNVQFCTDTASGVIVGVDVTWQTRQGGNHLRSGNHIRLYFSLNELAHNEFV